MIRSEIIKALAGRLFTSLLLLFLLITFLFFLLRTAPGDPLQKYITPELSPELNKAVREEFNLDQPAAVQYYTFLINLTKGEFGTSFTYRRPVIEVIFEFLPFTIIFSFLAMALQFSTGYFSAVYFFRKEKKSFDRKVSVLSLLLYSAPTFLTGILLILLFSEILNILPSSGLRSYSHDELSWTGKIVDYLRHLILPVITLSIGGAALFYNYFRENLDEISSRLFILNLKANGFRQNEIIKKHIVPNAIGPIISAAGVEFGILLGGALITEVIFSLPGMGRLVVYAILSRDYPLIIGCSFFAGSMVILVNLAADYIKGHIDSRLLTEGILN